LIGRHGLAIDNLRSAQLVTADGRVVTASKDENPDLFWGVRGGGGNFGVATSLEYAVHPVGPMITGGLVAHPFARAGEVLRFFRDTTTASMPDELTVFSALIHAPDGSGHKLAAIIACHCGSLADGAAALEPIKAFGSPVMDALGPMPYTAVNQMIDGGYPKGALNYWKSSFLASLSDEAIDVMTRCYESVPSPMSGIVLEHFHAAMTPFMSKGRYVNYLDADEAGDPVADAYGPNYERLRQLKKTFDPTNFFHLNQNIRPA
jgi:FAD/FMN-containing dehydrogenase